jgi:exodeoxyribonuclease V beta subunit
VSETFHVGSSCIEPGITLIEASAGTGKTYAIAGMVVRLIAEREFSISEILVVTFTEAATEELRDRVRSRIRDAITLLERNETGKDPALAGLVDAAPAKIAAAIRSLKKALLSFDEASIFTIHGFCQRMLRENAFETGALFDVELMTDATVVWRETAEDFWRRQFYHAPPELGAVVAWLQDQGRLSTGKLGGILQRLSRHPEVQLLPEFPQTSVAVVAGEITAILQRVRHEWPSCGAEVASILLGQDALSVDKRSGYPRALLEEMLEELKDLEREEGISPALLDVLCRLCAKQLAAKTKKKKTPPEHPFFHQCSEIAALLEKFVHVVHQEFVQFSRTALGEAKGRRNAITFDDLLTGLYKALQGDGGDALAAAVGERFRAALIDEFQDTDPVQWQIFSRIFGGGGHILFLIGDPKQAIYGFRGADIYTYLQAREQASAVYTLGINWRSDSRLIQATNKLFARHTDPFLFSMIRFQAVEAATREEGDEPELNVAGSGLAPQPLQLVCVPGEEGEKVSAEEARRQILEMLLQEIENLLSCGVTRKGVALEPGDIAVLVRKNKEAEAVRAKLREKRIPAVIRTDRSVLQTEEAEHLVRLLAAILEPQRNGTVKAALASPLFGYDAARIHDLDAKECEWQLILERLGGWQDIWNRQGFARMFRQFLVNEALRPRLLGMPDGERRVMNYQHIAECLHAAEYEDSLTPGTLLRWLREQNEQPDADSDTHVLRLEKDEKAVQIVTIHRSKGLEYPIVFCPFNWTQASIRKPDVIFHNAEDDYRLTWDLREPPSADFVAAAKQELLAEASRLLYVAVTRARNRCYLFWASTRDSEEETNNALAHIFGCGKAEEVKDSPLVAFRGICDEECIGAYSFEPRGADATKRRMEPAAHRLRARVFGGNLPQGPLITSFSGLTAQSHEAHPDWDAVAGGIPPIHPEEPAPGPSIFAFPKGAKAGNFFHGLLEVLDFTRPEDLPGLVRQYLRTYQFDQSYAPAVEKTLQELLVLPLTDRFQLAGISRADRVVEAPFHFPIRPVTPAGLAGLFHAEAILPQFADNLGRLRFHPVDGYMTGFIDLVVRHEGRYFIIDWKSNYLGGHMADYAREALHDAMVRSYYYLQYHLYTLALHRHLQVSLPEYEYDRHFGGVLYIFLRGVQLEDPSSGIFFDRPSFPLIEALESALAPPSRTVNLSALQP